MSTSSASRARERARRCLISRCTTSSPGEGVAVIDPHGDLAEAVADCIPPERTHSVCYLDAGDAERPVGFNPLANIPPERHALAASGIVSAFQAPVARELGTAAGAFPI